MEIFHGTKNFERSKWSFEKRLEILDDLAVIPAKFDLPICWGSTDRIAIPANVGAPVTGGQIEEIGHSHAFFKFVIQIETIMRVFANEEVAMLIAEDRPIMRKMLKMAHALLRGRAPPHLQKFLGEMLETETYFKILLPLERIIETVHFAQKTESSLLQIADLCAFAVKRHIAKSTYSELLYEKIENQILFTPKTVEALVSSVQPS